MALPEPTTLDWGSDHWLSELNPGDLYIDRTPGWSTARPTYCHAASVRPAVKPGRTLERTRWLDDSDDAAVNWSDGPATELIHTQIVDIDFTASSGSPGLWQARRHRSVEDRRVYLVASAHPAPTEGQRCWLTPAAAAEPKPAKPQLPEFGDPVEPMTSADWSHRSVKSAITGKWVGGAGKAQLREIAWRCEQLGLDRRVVVAAALRDMPVTYRLSFRTAGKVLTYLRRAHRKAVGA